MKTNNISGGDCLLRAAAAGLFLALATLADARQATIALVPDQTCYGVGATVTVTIDLSGVDGVDAVIGGQFRTAFDTTRLTFVSAAAASTVWTELIYQNVDGSSIDLSVGVPTNPPGTGALTGTMGILTFTTREEICSTAGLVLFRADEPPLYTRLSAIAEGSSVSLHGDQLTRTDLPAIAIDQSAPVLTGTVRDAFDGQLNAACQSIVQVNLSVTDNCCLNLADFAVNYSISGGTYDAGQIVITPTANTLTIAGSVRVTKTSGCATTFGLTVAGHDCCNNTLATYNWSRTLSDALPPALVADETPFAALAEDFKTDRSALWSYHTADWDCGTGQPTGNALDGTPTHTAGLISAPVLVSSCTPGPANVLNTVRTARALDAGNLYGGRLLGNLAGKTLRLQVRLSKPDMTPGTAFSAADFILPTGVNPHYNAGLGVGLKGTGSSLTDDYWYYAGAPNGIGTTLDATQMRCGQWAGLTVDLADAAKWVNCDGYSAALPEWNAKWAAVVADVDELRINAVGGDSLTGGLAFASGLAGTLDVDFVTTDGFQIAAATAPGTCTAPIALPTMTAADNCGVASPVTYWIDGTEITSPYAFTRGTTTVQARATDDCSQTATWNFDVLVSDQENPAITAPNALSVQCAGDVPPPATDAAAFLALTGAALSDNCTAPGSLLLAHVGDVSNGLTCPETITRTYRVTDESGNSATAAQTIVVNDTLAPDVTGCPSDMSVDADAGQCTALRTWAAPTVTDNCTAAPPVVYDIDLNNDASIDATVSQPSYAFPTGTHRVIVRATDGCGNVNNACGFTVTVSDKNQVVADVQLDGMLDGTSFTRCVRFWLCHCGGATETVDQEVSFVNGTAHDVAFVVNCGAYDCIMAEDPLHTLRLRIDTGPAFGVAGTQYVASFTNEHKLTQGDLYNDLPAEPRDVIDILDFGVYITEWGKHYGTVTCTTGFPHADLTADDIVDVSDYSFIQLHFFQLGDLACCTAQTDYAVEPRTSVSVAELWERGLGNLAAADLNGDGVLDLSDVEAFLNGARPEPPRPPRPGLPRPGPADAWTTPSPGVSPARPLPPGTDGGQSAGDVEHRGRSRVPN